MILALLVSMICIDIPSPEPWPISVSAVKHFTGPEAEIVAGDAQCCQCPCWLPPLGQCGCAIGTSPGPCGYQNVTEFGIPWGTWTISDSAGCVDMDLLPVPQEGWTYWVAAQ